MSPRKRLFARLALLVGSIALVSLGAEIAIRLRYPPSTSRSCCSQVHNYPWHEHDPRLGWRPRRSCKLMAPPPSPHPYEILTNSIGLRDEREFERSPREGTKRIAVIGDSYTFGALVASADAFPRLIEKKLGERGDRVEVMNWGVLGYGIDQMRTILDEALEWRPGLVLICFIGDDFQRPIHAFEVGEATRPLYVPGEDGSLAFVQAPDPRIDAWRDRQSLQVANPPESGSYLAWKVGNALRRSRRYASDDIARDARWLLAHALLLDAARAANAKGAKLAAVLLACYPPHGEDFRPVLPELEKEGVPFLDCYPGLEARFKKEPSAPLFIPDDGHPTEEGHRLIAEQLKAFVEERKLLGD